MNLSIFMEKKEKKICFSTSFSRLSYDGTQEAAAAAAAAWRGVTADGAVRWQRRYCNNYYLSTAALKMDWQIQGLPNN